MRQRWGFWLLYLAVFCTAVKLGGGGPSLYINQMLLAVLIAFAAVRHFMSRPIAIPTTTALFVGCFVCILIGSLYKHSDLEAFTQLAQLLIFVVCLFLSYLIVTDPRDLSRWILMTNLGCAVNAVVGLVQAVLWIRTNGLVFVAGGEFFRVMGVGVSPADFVALLMVGLALATAIVRPRLRAAAVALYVVMLLLSLSRSGIVVVGVAGAWGIVHRWRRTKAAAPKVAVVLAAAALAVGLSFVPVVATRVTDIGNINFNIKRLVTFQDVFARSTESAPAFLFGHGLGNYLFFNPYEQAYYNNTHDVYLLMLYGLGFIGFAAFFLLVGSLIRLAVARYRAAAPGSSESGWMRSVLLVHAFTWIVALVETNIVGVGSGWVMAAVLGLPITVRHLGRAPCAS